MTYVDLEEKGEDITVVCVLQLKKVSKTKTSKSFVTYEVIDSKVIKHNNKIKAAVIVKTRKWMGKFKEQYNIQ